MARSLCAIAIISVETESRVQYTGASTSLASKRASYFDSSSSTVDDSIVPNSTSESLARAAGLVHLNPLRKVSGLASAEAPLTGGGPGGATGAFVQFDKVNGDQIASHGELIFTEEARAQYVTFFASGLGAAHATVEPAYP